MFEIKVELEQDNQQLGEVVVVADAKKNTENAIITQQRTSLVMQRRFLPSRLPRRKIKMLRK